jgi:hypothetical protein
VWGSKNEFQSLLPEPSKPPTARRPRRMSAQVIAERAQAGAERYRARKRKGCCRPSETEEMHTWPFTQFPQAGFHRANANASLAADFLECLRAPDSTICEPPVTGPRVRSLEAVLEYDRLRTQDLNKNLQNIAKRVKAAPPLAHPRDIWINPNTWDRINVWIDTYDKEFERCARMNGSDGMEVRFNYSLLEGGKHGLHFGPEHVRPEYRGIPFVFEGKEGPCRPMEWTHPQENTELNLAAIWQYVVKTWEEGDAPFDDIEIAWDLTHQGLALNTNFEAGVHLCPNYPKLFAWLKTARKKEDSKLQDFDIARLIGPAKFLPSVPCFLIPNNMATDQTDDEGNIKPRQTANPGKSGDSLPFKGKCAPNSLNGMTDFEALPDIDYFSLRALAHEAATLMCAGEKLISIASDAESWYEQIPRRCFDTLCTYRWTTTRGMFRDPRNIFGFRAEPLNTQRISFLNRYAGHREAMKLQRQREKENSLPPTTMVFAQIRRAAGMSGAIFSNGWFFDDSGSVVVESFERDFSTALTGIRKHFNLSMADGRQEKGRLVKNKHTRADPDQEFILLGLRQVVQPPGRLTTGAGKRGKYTAAGQELASKVSKSASFSQKKLQRWTSQMAFVANVDPDCRVDLQRLRSQIGAPHISLSSTRRKHTALAISNLVKMLSESSGIALQRMLDPLNASRRPLIINVSDAAKDLKADFAGYGFWFWEPASGRVFYDMGRWSHFEQSQLSPAALELHAMTMGLYSISEWAAQWWPRCPKNPHGVGPFVWMDVIQIADNSSAAEHTGNTEHASADAERHLAQRRSRAQRHLQMRVQSHTAVRETLIVQAADHLSKNLVAEFFSCMVAIFGPGIECCRLDPPLLAARELKSTIKFARSVRE